MTKRIGILAVVMVLLLILVSPALSQVSGQGQISVSNSAAQIDFPLNLNFSATIKSNAAITDIRLRYQIEQISYAQVTSEVFIPFTQSSNVSVKYALNLQKFGGIPPGATIDYWWLVKDASGAHLETSPLKYQANDNRYSWHNLSQGNINLYWYNGDNNFAQTLMTTGQQALVKLAKDTGATPSKAVNIYIYGSSSDLQGAMIYPNEWTGGVAYTQYGIIAIGIPLSQLSWGQGAMTHELTHLVVFQVVANPYNDLPVWLNEGLAMYNQGPLDAQFTVPLANAIKTNSLFSVRSISSPFSAYSDKSVQAYAQSYSLIDFLVSQYGADKMQQLLNTFKQGSDYDPAFQKVYGFDMDGLNNLWKPWVTTHYGK
jgi:hypothetical protein